MAQPDKPIQVTITRTDYAPGIPNVWQVKAEDPAHLTHHHTVEEALLMVRVIMERIEEDQVHR
jgi:hypothetical protein